MPTLREKIAAAAGDDAARRTVRAELILARARLYAATKAVDAALKLDTDQMAEAARPLVAAARLLPDA
ncbi:MAG TPA: hypothetical protein PLX84_09095 [Acidiphilium sp.]|nr:hypothetical protein [Acidiphilium sp.]